MINVHTSMHTFRSTPLVVKHDMWGDLMIHMLNGLPDVDAYEDTDKCKPRGSYYDSWEIHRRAQAANELRRSTVVIGSLRLPGVALEDFLDLFKQVSDFPVRVERFVKLPFDILPWNVLTVRESDMQARPNGNISFTDGIVLHVGSDPVIFVEGC